MVAETNSGAKRLLNQAFSAKGKTKTDIAHELGISSQSFFNKMNRNTFSFIEAQKIADLLGFDVVLKDRETGKVIE